MVRQSTPRRRRSVALQVEQLEERLSPAVIEAYPGAPYRNNYGDTVPGVYRERAPYITPAGFQKEVVLDPLTPTTAVSENFRGVLEGTFGVDPYVFYYPSASPPGLNLTVKTYYANANSSIHLSPPPQPGDMVDGGRAGGILDVTTNYQPVAGEIVRWIQVITTNSPGEQTLDHTESYLDNSGSDMLCRKP